MSSNIPSYSVQDVYRSVRIYDVERPLYDVLPPLADAGAAGPWGEREVSNSAYNNGKKKKIQREHLLLQLTCPGEIGKCHTLNLRLDVEYLVTRKTIIAVPL